MKIIANLLFIDVSLIKLLLLLFFFFFISSSLTTSLGAGTS
jgi:hypothetical protein